MKWKIGSVKKEGFLDKLILKHILALLIGRYFISTLIIYQPDYICIAHRHCWNDWVSASPSSRPFYNTAPPNFSNRKNGSCWFIIIFIGNSSLWAGHFFNPIFLKVLNNHRSPICNIKSNLLLTSSLSSISSDIYHCYILYITPLLFSSTIFTPDNNASTTPTETQPLQPAAVHATADYEQETRLGWWPPSTATCGRAITEQPQRQTKTI